MFISDQLIELYLKLTFMVTTDSNYRKVLLSKYSNKIYVKANITFIETIVNFRLKKLY